MGTGSRANPLLRRTYTVITYEEAQAALEAHGVPALEVQLRDVPTEDLELELDESRKFTAAIEQELARRRTFHAHSNEDAS
jgi:hypothetical protein